MGNEAAKLRDQGDAARDKGEWPEAATAYRLYLQVEPADASIWVQLGHSLKESGDHDGAEVAYRRALALTPNDSDILLQLGHLMKVTRRSQDASRLYKEALVADPNSAAYGELVAMGQGARAERALHRARTKNNINATYFQVDDLLNYLNDQKTVSGIQRTVVEVARHIFDNVHAASATHYSFVFTELFGTRLLEAPAKLLRDVISYLDETSVELSVLKQMIADIKAQAKPATITSGSCYVMLGAFWGVVNNSAVLAELKQAGVRIGVYLYDLIPVDFPEFCVPALVNDFAQSLAEALCYVDFAFAISEFTAQSVRNFLEVHGFPAIPVGVVPLGHGLSAVREGALVVDPEHAFWSPSIGALRGRRFVLYVSTIEIRKNHKYIFDIWKLLIAEGIDVPDLVFVGRRGWRVTELFEQLKSTQFLNGRVHVLHGLTDQDLEILYRACLFTVFPSFIEGWGLPAGESLAYGKVCVAANTSALAEVGGDLIPYVDPLNIRDGQQVIRQLLGEQGALARWEAGIRERFKPRSWDDVSRDILAYIGRQSEVARTMVNDAFVPSIPSRHKVSVAAFSPFSEIAPRSPMHRTYRLMLRGSWHRADEVGAWMVGRRGGVYFASDVTPGETIVVFLELMAPKANQGSIITIDGPERLRLSVALPADETTTIRLVVKTDFQSRVRLDFRVSLPDKTMAADPDAVGIGVAGLTYVAAIDGIGRVDVIERVFFEKKLRIS